MSSSFVRWSGGLRQTSTFAGVAVFFFLYAPIAVLVAYSFSASSSLTFPIKAFSTAWYVKLAHNDDLLQAVGNSLSVVAGVVPLTLILGVPAAYALHRMRVPGAFFFQRLFMLPLMVPGLVTGLSVLLILKGIGFGLALWAVVLGHVVAWLPIVIGQIAARLSRLDPRVEEASADLGAGALETFWRVVIPNIRNAIIGSALLVFTLSFDEIAITFMLTGSENTLPMYIWAMLRRGVTPEICAVASLAVLVSVVLLIVGLRLSRDEDA
jgi:spermidine/putrescine transport system permease protein